jgi:hypothetical protein
MAEKKFTTVGTGRANEIKSARGSEAGKDAKYDAAEEKEQRQRYRAHKGAAGIGNSAKRNTKEFRAGEEAYIAGWKKRRSAAAAKKEAQRRASSDLAKKAKKSAADRAAAEKK